MLRTPPFRGSTSLEMRRHKGSMFRLFGAADDLRESL